MRRATEWRRYLQMLFHKSFPRGVSIHHSKTILYITYIIEQLSIRWQRVKGKFLTTGVGGYRSVQFIHLVMTDSLWPYGLKHTRLLCPSPAPGAYSNSCPSHWWCHPTILSSVVPLSSCLQSFQESGSFQMSQLFVSGGQSIGISASASVIPMNIQDWFPLGCTGWNSLQSQRLSRVFSNTTVQKHQFFSAQLSL